MNKFDLKRYLTDFNIEFRDAHGNGCIKFELKNCVFDPSHTNNDACIFQYDDTGVIVYKCLHNSCSSYGWQDAKRKISGDKKLSHYWPKTSNPVEIGVPIATEDIDYITFDEIFDITVEINPIVEKIIYEGDQTVIHGTGGIGKSLFALYIALSLASADEYDYSKYIWQDFKLSKSRKTLFLQAENSKAVMNQRLKAICKGNEVLEKGMKNLFTVSRHDDVMLTGKSFADEEFRNWLVGFIKKIESDEGIKLDILVIDPLISFFTGDENDATKARAALDGVTSVCQQAQVTPIVIHHNNRNDNYRGSSAIWDWARNMIGLRHKQIPVMKEIGMTVYLPCIEVVHEKCNNHRRFDSFVLKIDDNANFHRLDTTLPPEKLLQCQNVVKALEKLGGEADSENALATAYGEISNLGKTTCRKHVKMAVEHDFIEQIANGSSGSKKSFKYKLAS